MALAWKLNNSKCLMFSYALYIVCSICYVPQAIPLIREVYWAVSMFTAFELHHTDNSHLLVRNVLAFCSLSETNISMKTRECNANDLSYGSYMYLRAKNLDCQNTVINLMFISLIKR